MNAVKLGHAIAYVRPRPKPAFKNPQPPTEWFRTLIFSLPSSIDEEGYAPAESVTVYGKARELASALRELADHLEQEDD